ncbi:MAG: hypothetical protein GF334_10555 [Candidatus Altiarchaeales archaeon]|nr:hypothetical protein [Candidatus Altiarchaeales archaeon]
MKIQVEVGGFTGSAELFNSELAKEIYGLLPINSDVIRWGDEIYFPVPLEREIQKPTTDLEVGDLAFWPAGSCFCIFYGRTPASTDNKPAPASPVEVFGKLGGAEKLVDENPNHIEIKKL